MYKQSFRSISKRLLNYIPDEDKEKKVHQILNNLTQLDQWLDADTIALTIPRSIELNTHLLIEHVWKCGKKIVIPKCYPGQGHMMQFYEYTNRGELENVYLDLYEPKPDKNKFIPKDQIDLIVVPGLLFDKNCYRIGYGGGYYDRFLADFHGIKLSIAMEDQIVSHLPHESYDLPIDFLVTEKQIYTFS